MLAYLVSYSSNWTGSCYISICC